MDLSVVESGAGGPFRQLKRARRVAAAVLLVGVALPVRAAAVDASSAQGPITDPNQEIIVVGTRLFNDIQPERELDEAGVTGYGASTVDDLLAEIQAELGDDSDPPLILVDGERMSTLDDIGALPVEVLRNVKVLPRGSAVRAGGTASQRVISLTLKPEVRSATLVVAPRIATEGDWSAGRGEAILTYIRGATRANVAFRARGEGSLLESDRDIIQPGQSLPAALGGNLVGFPSSSGEIDPLLSAAAGGTVTVAPVPLAASPSLADFAANANQAAVTDLGRFRTLNPETRNYDLNATFAARLAPWLTSTATIRLGMSLRDSKRGLPSALFIVSPDNLFSPFSTDVGLAYFGRQPLHTRSKRDSGEASLTLNGRFGQWTSNFNARYSQSRDETRSQRQNVFGAIFLDDSVDPFGGGLSDLVSVRTDRATARSVNGLAQLIFSGPAARLPAGDLRATIEGRITGNRLRSSSSFSVLSGNRKFRRSDQSIRASVEVPLTSSEFLPEVGNLSATAEVNWIHYSDAGRLDNYELGLAWEPRPMLRLRGEIAENGRPPSIQVLGNPVIVTPDVRVFDPLTGETVDIVQISGGNPSLRPEKTKIRRFSAALRLVERLNLELNAEYTDTDSRNFISSLPDASAAVMLAFPDRFVRSGGVLTTVDLRPVNFDSQREKRLRYGFNLNTTIGGGPRTTARVGGAAESDGGEDETIRPAAPSVRAGRSRPPTRLQLNANHSIVFLDRITIRPGLDSVDLLEGGAIGIAGGQVRHQFDGTASITSGGIGARLGVTWRGRSTLESRIGGVTDTLRFAPVLAVNLRAFADVHRLLPRSEWTRRMRLSLNLLNATNDRQRVRDSAGFTPLQYQPGYRDPLGRTIELELRKVF